MCPPDFNSTGRHDLQPAVAPVYTGRVQGSGWRRGNYQIVDTVADAESTVVVQSDNIKIPNVGEFTWNPTSTATRNGTTVLQITNPETGVAVATGRWEAVAGSTIRTILPNGTSANVSEVGETPLTFRAGTGTADDGPDLQAFLNALPVGPHYTINFYGPCHFVTRVVARSHTTLHFRNGSTPTFLLPSASAAIGFDASDTIAARVQVGTVTTQTAKNASTVRITWGGATRLVRGDYIYFPTAGGIMSFEVDGVTDNGANGDIALTKPVPQILTATEVCWRFNQLVDFHIVFDKGVEFAGGYTGVNADCRPLWCAYARDCSYEQVTVRFTDTWDGIGTRWGLGFDQGGDANRVIRCKVIGTGANNEGGVAVECSLDVVVEDFEPINCYTGIVALGMTNLRIINPRIENTTYGIQLSSNAPSATYPVPCSNVTISGPRITGVKGSAFAYGPGCDGITIIEPRTVCSGNTAHHDVTGAIFGLVGTRAKNVRVIGGTATGGNIGVWSNNGGEISFRGTSFDVPLLVFSQGTADRISFTECPDIRSTPGTGVNALALSGTVEFSDCRVTLTRGGANTQFASFSAAGRLSLRRTTITTVGNATAEKCIANGGKFPGCRVDLEDVDLGTWTTNLLDGYPSDYTVERGSVSGSGAVANWMRSTRSVTLNSTTLVRSPWPGLGFRPRLLRTAAGGTAGAPPLVGGAAGTATTAIAISGASSAGLTNFPASLPSVIENSANAVHMFALSLAGWTAVCPAVARVRAQATGRNFIVLSDAAGEGATFNLTNGAVSSVIGVGTVAWSRLVSTGIYDCYVYSPIWGANHCDVYLSPDGPTLSYTGSGVAAVNAIEADYSFPGYVALTGAASDTSTYEITI